jgi:Helix-turn-helix domain
VNEGKAGVDGMAGKNGKAESNRFNIVADQIKAAASRLRSGRHEAASDKGSVALNQALAETWTVDGAPASEPSQPRNPPVATNDTDVLRRASESPVTPSNTIDLVSAVNPPSDRKPPRGPASIINLRTAASQTPVSRIRPSAEKPVVGSPGTQPNEDLPGRMGEAFPQDSRDESGSNSAAQGAASAETTLGTHLLASRERNGIKREDVLRDTRIPAHYLRMLESNDYSMIADQLYLLPFLRRYAEYLGLDSEEIAIRFVREVQRNENSPATTASNAASGDEGALSNRWAIIGALAVITLIACWIILQRHHAAVDGNSQAQSQVTNPAAGAAANAARSIPGGSPSVTGELVAAPQSANPPVPPSSIVPAPKRAPTSGSDDNAPVPPGGTE